MNTHTHRLCTTPCVDERPLYRHRRAVQIRHGEGGSDAVDGDWRVQIEPAGVHTTNVGQRVVPAIGRGGGAVEGDVKAPAA